MNAISASFPLASNRLTLVFLFALFLAVSLYQYMEPTTRLAALLTPTFLLMVNFIIAMFRKKVFASKPALLVFHMALFVFVIQIIISQLTFLKGTTEVGTMQDFGGVLENVQAGPWHDYTLDEKTFTNLGFRINYREGIQRDNTINRIRINEDNGSSHTLEIGDNVPLLLGHYRLYTSHNKGYAPIFTWIPYDNTPPLSGSVHLPAYPINEYEQAREWVLPGTQTEIWTMLILEENVIPDDRSFSFQIPQKHHVVIRIGEQRVEMSTGDQIELENGTLRYETLSSWMGYTVDYDWTRPWLLATCMIAMLSLSVHYLITIFRS
jgi:cytochrome c biogenesis protein